MSTAFFLLTAHLLLPFYFVVTLWMKRYESKLEWLPEVLAAVAFIAWVFQAGRWDWLGYSLRYIWVILLMAAVIRSWMRVRSLPFRIKYKGNQLLSMGIQVVLLFVFALYNVWVLGSYTTKEPPITLRFPMEEGTYYVGQGGNSVQMNYHHDYLPQRYALDIVKLNGIGTRAAGFYPKDLDKYAIYGDNIYSPCQGQVIKSRDGLPDLTPPETDPDHPEGNYILLRCDQTDVDLYIAHLQNGSLQVKEGDPVTVGQWIGKVGNSGNTTEPHLHIHAEREGVGVPIDFEGRFLVRNSIVR